MSSADAADLHLEVVRDPAALEALRQAWEALLAQVASPSLFLTPTWITTWWSVFGRDRSLHVVTLRDRDGALVGIAPLQITRGHEGVPPKLRVLSFIGQSGDTLAEELDVIVRPGHEREVAQVLVRHLLGEEAPGFDLLRLARMRMDSAFLPRFEEAMEALGMPVERRGIQPSPALRLPVSQDELLRAQSRNFRSQLRNARNRLAREGEVTCVWGGSDVPVGEAMDTVIALHRQRWGPDDGSFDTDAYVTFHKALAPRLAEEGRLVLALLQVDGKPVAARYDFAYAKRIWCFQGGWNPAYERMRVGTLLTEDVLRWGVDRGFAEYAFLSGEDAYKTRWSDVTYELVDVHAWGRSPAARRARRRGRLREAAKRIPLLRWVARKLRRGASA